MNIHDPSNATDLPDDDRRRLLKVAAALAVAAALPFEDAAAAQSANARRFRFGMGVSMGTFWNTQVNFCNLLLDSDYDWRDTSTDRIWNPHLWRWPQAVPAGKVLTRVIKLNENPHPDGLPSGVHVRTGKYVIRTRGGWRISMTNAVGLADVVPGRDVCTFTIPEADKRFQIQAVLQHDDPTPKDLVPGDFVAFHVEDEAALRADPFAFRPDMLENYRGFSILRSSDVSGANGGYPYTDARSVPPLSHFNGGFWPPEIFARLCKAVGAGMWINMPTFIDAANAECSAKTGRFRLMRGDDPMPAPPNGARMMWLGGNDAIKPPGFDSGPYTVLNSDAATRSFQLADPALPTIPKRSAVDIKADYRTGMTRLYDYEELWRSYLQRLYDVYPECPVIRSEPFLENWNWGYQGGPICGELGNYYRTGSRTGGNRFDGQCFFILKSWKIIEARFGRERHVRTVAGQLSGWVGAPLIDCVDVTGEIQRGARLGQLLQSVSVATYYNASEPAMPPLGTVDFNDPKLDVPRQLSNKSMRENGELSREALVAEWRSRGPFTNTRWADMLRQSFHYTLLNLRQWRDRMAKYGRVAGSDYDFAAYECGNHQRRDRPAYPGGKRDIDTDIQDSFIAFNYGHSPEAQAFRIAYRKMHEDASFSLGMAFHMAGDWYRGSQQVMQWGALPWYGAEKTQPQLRGWYDFLKENA